MKTQRFVFSVFILLVVISLSACVRPASQAPTSLVTPTSGGGIPLPGTNDNIMEELEKAATQTLMALEAGTPQAAVTEPPVAEATPIPTEAPTAVIQAVEPTQALVVVPTATPGIPKSYTLQRGEHPYCIARRFNVNPDELLRLSGLSRSSTYYAGMDLTIPQTGNTFPANRSLRNHPGTYVVQSGDTIFSVACLYGDVDPYAIAAANSLQSPYRLDTGQTIQIP